MDIDRMSAGREMDLRIAEAVMGWRRLPRNNVVVLVPPYFDEMDSKQWVHTIFVTECTVANLRVPRGALPYYSTNIAAAWEVVKHLSRQGIEVVVCEGFSGNLSTCMLYQGVATDYPPRDLFLHLAQIEETWLHFGDIVIRTQAETVPLAICRAALSV